MQATLKQCSRLGLIAGVAALLVVTGAVVITLHSGMASQPVFLNLTIPTSAGDRATSVSPIRIMSDSIIATVPLPGTPNGLTLDAANGEVYVSDSCGFSCDGNVTALDGVTYAVESTLRVGPYPGDLFVDPATGILYVADANEVSLINATTNTLVGNLEVGSQPHRFAYDPAADLIFLLNLNSNNVSVISGGSEVLSGTIPVGGGPAYAMFDAANGELYVANRNSNNVSVIDVASRHSIGQIPVGTNPQWLALNSSDGLLYVSNTNSNNVSVIDTSDNEIVATVSTGAEPFSTLYLPSTGRVYAANQASANVSVIDGATNLVVASPAVQSDPYAMAYAPPDSLLFVGNYVSNSVSVISTASDTSLLTIPVGSGPSLLSYDRDGDSVIVANSVSENLSIIRAAQLYSVSCEQTGLPPGTQWWVNITGQLSLSSTGPTITTNLTNGSYAYAIGSANKTWAAPGGSFTVNGSALAVPVTFTKQTFHVMFAETGLPAKTLTKDWWTVVLNGTMEHSPSNTIAFTGIANGTYPVLITGPSGFDMTGSGQVTVKGATSVAVTVSKGKTVTLTFGEKGLPKTQGWCASVDWALECTTKTSQKYLNLTAGVTYDYIVFSLLGGYNITQKVGKVTTYGPDGAVTPAGNVKVSVTFAYRYAVTFTETGAPGGSWSVTIKGHTETAAWNSPIQFNLTNGTYTYKIGAITGYKSVGVPSKVTVNGAATSVKVTFAKRS